MKGKIYILRSHQTEEVYYGSTIQKYLSSRLASHNAKYKKYVKGEYEYVSSFDIIKYPDAYIELVEEIDYENRAELTSKEGEYIRNNECINKRIAGRTPKQYYEEEKDKILKYHKEYYQKNRDENTPTIREQKTGSLFQKENGSFQASITITKVRHQKTFKTKEEAEMFLKNLHLV